MSRPGRDPELIADGQITLGGLAMERRRDTVTARRWALAAAAVAGVAVVFVILALTGGEGGTAGTDATSTTTPTAPAASRSAARLAELQARITDYCEIRNSGAAAAGQDEQAAADVEALIRLVRRDPHAAPGRRALAEVRTVLSADCLDSPLVRRVERALTALR